MDSCRAVWPAYTYAATGSVQFGSSSADVITGTVGDDHLFGLAVDDTLTGGLGNNSIEGADGVDGGHDCEFRFPVGRDPWAVRRLHW